MLVALNYGRALNKYKTNDKRAHSKSWLTSWDEHDTPEKNNKQ